jgi:hypothetical protein
VGRAAALNLARTRLAQNHQATPSGGWNRLRIRTVPGLGGEGIARISSFAADGGGELNLQESLAVTF